jgi:hypothetical protein
VPLGQIKANHFQSAKISVYQSKSLSQFKDFGSIQDILGRNSIMDIFPIALFAGLAESVYQGHEGIAAVEIILMNAL